MGFFYANTIETLYFKVAQTVGEQTAESNVVAVAKSMEDIAISAEATYDEESGVITISWNTNKDGGDFEIFMSKDGETYTSVGTVENKSEFSYTPEDEFETLYFKVKQTLDKKTAESNVSEVNFYIDWEDETDTDNDGLTDVYEKYQYKTDPTNPDTDGDGLPDGYEVLTLGTDPAKADTDDNGISDANEDFDEDGLSNFEEYQLETDPLSKDTDNDGLSDYDEINTYNTDPLKYDTDGDIVSDGDEIALGLNPLSPVTNGIPDNEKTFEQTIDSDNFILYFVNTEVNPFEVSLKVNAAGVAENNLEAEISGYNYIMKNEAVLGAAPAFSYTDGLKVEDVVINFDLDNSVTANTNGKYTGISEEFAGIKRFNIFRYFEDTNMLLPVETFHDVENNRVYANSDELGTYCLVDMEIWLDSLGITPEAQQANIMTLALNDTGAVKVKNGDNLDVVFVLYSTSTYLKYMTAEIISAIDDIFKEAEKQNVSARIHFVSWTGGLYTNESTGLNYAENVSEAAQMINRTYTINTNITSPDKYPLTNIVVGIRDRVKDNLQKDSNKYCFIVDAGCMPRCSSKHAGVKNLQEQGYDFSFIYSPGNSNASNYSSISSNNGCYQFKLMPGRMAFSEYVFDRMFDKTEELVKIISAAGLTELPEDFGEISTASGQDYDNDGLLDVQEIYFDVTDKNGSLLVTVNDDGSVELPSFNKCVSVGGTYVEQGLKRFYNEADESILSQLDDIKVLPIISDPTSKDSDGDGILDLTEFEIMQKVRGSIRLYSVDNSETVTESETENPDEQINPALSNSLVNLFKFNSITKMFESKLINKNTVTYAYTLAKEKGFEFKLDDNINTLNNTFDGDSSKPKVSAIYGTLGTEKDTFYLEAYSEVKDDGSITNELRINLNLLFKVFDKSDQDANLKTGVSWSFTDNGTTFNETITQSEMIKYLKEKWSGSYNGSAYDFYEGMNVDVSVCVNTIEIVDGKKIRRIDNTNNTAEYKGNHAFINLKVHAGTADAPDAGTSGNPHTKANFTGENSDVFLFTYRRSGNTNASDNIDNKDQTKADILAVFSHEIGHVMGLMDAYGENNDWNFNIEPVSFPDEFIDDGNSIHSELYFNRKTSVYNKPEAGEIMYFNGKVCANDIEMVIWARKKSERQYFVPIGVTLDTDDNITGWYGLSKAIRAKYIYLARSSATIEYHSGVSGSTYYISEGVYYYFDFDNHVYKKAESRPDISIFTELDESSAEYQMYEKYFDKIWS